MDTMTTDLTKLDLEKLAYDVALRYDTPEELCLRHGIDEPMLERIQAIPQFQKAVLVAEREITETGKEFKLKARKLSSLVLDDLAAIALSDKADHSARISAIKELTRLAGYGKDDTAPGSAFQVNINLG